MYESSPRHIWFINRSKLKTLIWTSGYNAFKWLFAGRHKQESCILCFWGLFADGNKIAKSWRLVNIPVAISCAEVKQQLAESNTLLSVKAKLVYSAVTQMVFPPPPFTEFSGKHFIFFNRNVLPIQKRNSLSDGMCFLPCNVWNWGGLLKYSVWREVTR